MPRRRRFRRIVKPPSFKGFKPYGHRINQTESIHLLYEEYEAIKLSDYDKLKHDQASELMGISRSTFARIYESARQKIAKALVETREIETKYGHAALDKSWFKCLNCESTFTIPSNFKIQCAMCTSTNIKPLENNK